MEYWNTGLLALNASLHHSIVPVFQTLLGAESEERGFYPIEEPHES